MTTPEPDDPETDAMPADASVVTPQTSAGVRIRSADPAGVTVRRVDPPPAVSWVCATALVVLCFEIPTATWLVLGRLSEIVQVLATRR